MTVSFVCPDSFKDYDFIKKELSKLVGITRIICATSNATRLTEAYVFEHGNIEYGHEKRGGKFERMRRIIKDSDEVLLIEFTDYDPSKTDTSRTQIALAEAQKRMKPLYFFEYDRNKEPMYQDKAKLLDAIDHFCMPFDDVYAKRYVHPLSQALPEFRDDKDIVLHSVQRHGFSFDFASRALQKEKKMVMEVIKLNKDAFPYVCEKLRKDNEIKNILSEQDRCKYENATTLFRERQEIKKNDYLVHSESRWSTIAHMALIWLSKKEGSELKVFRSIYTSQPEQWLVKENNPFVIKDWKLSNSIVEGKIRDLFFKSKSSISKREVDIMKIEDKKLIFIEVKTVGTTVEKSIEADKKLKNEILNLGYTCEFYYLLSYGNEPKGNKHIDWMLLDKHKCNILLWEDLLLKISDSPLMDYISKDIDMSEWKNYKGFLSF